MKPRTLLSGLVSSAILATLSVASAALTPLLNVSTSPNQIFASWPTFTPSVDASGLMLQVTPLDVNFTFSQTEPFSALQGWIVDDGSLVTNFSGVSSISTISGALSISSNRAVRAISDRGSPPPPYVLRRVPATGVVQTRIASCAGLSAQPNYFCGVVAFHAGQNAHLFFFGLFHRGGQLQLAVDSRGGNTLGVITGAWGDGAELQLKRDALGGTWECRGRMSSSQDWSTSSVISFSDSSPGMTSFDEGYV